MGLFDFSKKSRTTKSKSCSENKVSAKVNGVVSDSAKENENKYSQIDSELIALDAQLKAQDAQLESIKNAEKKYELDGDIDYLIKFWENIWNNGGLLFNGSKWTFRLPDLYIKQKRYDNALSILRKIRNPSYSDKKKSYIERIEKLKQKTKK